MMISSRAPAPTTGRGGAAAAVVGRPLLTLLRERQKHQHNQRQHYCGARMAPAPITCAQYAPGVVGSAARRRTLEHQAAAPSPSRASPSLPSRRALRLVPLLRSRLVSTTAAAAAAGDADTGHADDNEQHHQQQQQQQQQAADAIDPTPTPTPTPTTARPLLPAPAWPPSAGPRVMALWLLAYLFLGRVFVPLLASLGLPLQAHPSAGPGGGGVALAHLALDAAQLAATCAILRASLGRPWAALRREGLFCFGWRRAREWVPAVAAGCLAFPAVGWAARAAAAGLDAGPVLLGPLEDAAAAGAAAASAGGGLVVEAGAAAAAAPGGGGAAAAAAVGYALVVAVCAPLWEEAVFRGFLLPSLAAYGPWSSGRGSGGGGGGAAAEGADGAGGANGKGGADGTQDALPPSGGATRADALRAVVISAAAFAGCHFRADTALPMFLLGLLFGAVCVATRGGLAAPVALHGLWNLWAVANSAMAG